MGDIPIYTVNISLQMVHTSYKWSKYLIKNERLTFLKSWHGLLTTEINLPGPKVHVKPGFSDLLDLSSFQSNMFNS